MPWHHKEPGHQQPWYLLSWTNIIQSLHNSSLSHCEIALSWIPQNLIHYIDVIMTTIASQITSLTVVNSTVYSDADERKHQSSASLAFVWGIHRDRWISRTKGQLRGKCFHLMTSSCNEKSTLVKVMAWCQDSLFMYGDFLYNDKMAMRLSYHYDGNPYTAKTASFFLLKQPLGWYWPTPSNALGPILLTSINFNPSMDK